MEADEVEAAIDELYSLSPEEFTAARDALVKIVRTSDKERAAEVKSLRKPTVAAWAVNQAARRRPELIDDLDQTAVDARRAQQALLSGRGSSGVRAATARRRDVVAALTAAALDALGRAGRPVTDAVRDAVIATFDAAALDDDARSTVRSGRLAKELEAAAGFGDVGGFTLLSGGVGTDEAQDEEQSADLEDDANPDVANPDDATAAAAVRAAEVERLTHVAERAERAAARAAKDAERAAAEVERITSDLERARVRASAATKAASAAADEAAAAHQALTAIQADEGPGS